MVLSSRRSHCNSSQFIEFIWRIQTRRRVAANHQTKPTNFHHQSAGKAATTRIHHRHLLLLLSQKADVDFTVPRRVAG